MESFIEIFYEKRKQPLYDNCVMLKSKKFKLHGVISYLVSRFGVLDDGFESLDFRSKFSDEFDIWILQKNEYKNQNKTWT